MMTDKPPFQVPMAELHCHIEGSASPRLVQQQANKYGVDVSGIIRDDRYVWHDFTSFLAAYDLAASLFRSAEDYVMLAHGYLCHLASQGAIYSEFFVSIDHARISGTPPEAYLEGLCAGIASARQTSGIEARMIGVGLRHAGPDAVLATAKWHAANPRDELTGFGMAGDERQYDTREFAAAFAVARESGLAITSHAGELAGAASVAETIEYLAPSRIGHGVRAIEDAALVEQIAEAGIVLEVCPGSNIALGLYPDHAYHPLPRLLDANCRVTLNSDDPPFFHTDLRSEYENARDKMGIVPERLAAMTRTAIEAAFVDGDTRNRLLARLNQDGIA